MGLYTPSNILGTSLADNAATGFIGEHVTATLATASAVALTTATTANITSISLTAGDWDVDGVADYNPAATTSIAIIAQGISTTTAALDGQDTFAQVAMATNVPGANVIAMRTPTRRLSLAVTTTVYLVTNCTFTLAALTAFGSIRARRVR